MAAAQNDVALHKKQKMKANPRALQIVQDTDQKTMEEAFKSHTNEERFLKHQGSKHLHKKPNKKAAEGRLENFTNTEIVPFLPHPQTRSRTEHRNKTDGTHEELEQEWRQAPTQMDDWQEQMRILYTTLMMVICVHQEHKTLSGHDGPQGSLRRILVRTHGHATQHPTKPVQTHARRKKSVAGNYNPHVGKKTSSSAMPLGRCKTKTLVD
jgi:hypothetical protein